MKIAYAYQMQAIDRSAMQDYKIPGIVLMENAGIKTVEAIKKILSGKLNRKITILAGKGNNGGDGMVIARHLINLGAEVNICLLADKTDISGDAAVNLHILENMQVDIKVFSGHFDNFAEELKGSDLIVDAIYGTGFRGVIKEPIGVIVNYINESRIPVISVDIPSGVEADSGIVNGPAIKADYTVTFALPKMGLLLEPGREYVGKLIVADISIPSALLNTKDIKNNLITPEIINRLLLPRQAESHKGDYGHALFIGGSVGMMGAIAMSAAAALRSGAGLVTAALPKSLVYAFQSAQMEIMVKALEENEGRISSNSLPMIAEMLNKSSACGIGPGMSVYPESFEIVEFVLQNAKQPVLIDADGINAVANDKNLFKKYNTPIVITPHPGEISRLTGKSIAEIQSRRVDIARNYAEEWGITIVLKGNRTVVATPEGEVYLNVNGNPGMATAGSGDVLSGIITAFLAQGLKTTDAAIAGVYIHGRSGDIMARQKGQRSLVAGDLIKGLPLAFIEAEKMNTRRSRSC